MFGLAPRLARCMRQRIQAPVVSGSDVNGGCARPRPGTGMRWLATEHQQGDHSRRETRIVIDVPSAEFQASGRLRAYLSSKDVDNSHSHVDIGRRHCRAAGSAKRRTHLRGLGARWRRRPCPRSASIPCARLRGHGPPERPLRGRTSYERRWYRLSGRGSVPRDQFVFFGDGTVAVHVHSRRCNPDDGAIASSCFSIKTTSRHASTRSECRACCAGHCAPSRPADGTATGRRRSLAAITARDTPHLRGHQGLDHGTLFVGQLVKVHRTPPLVRRCDAGLRSPRRGRTVP